MDNILKGFDFNDALENDINDNIGSLSKQNMYNFQIDEIKQIFKKYGFKNIIIDIVTNIISIKIYYRNNIIICINNNIVNNKLIIDIDQTMSYIRPQFFSGDNKINICKELIDCNKRYFVFDKIEIGIYFIQFNEHISKFNNLPTYTLYEDDLYFINSFIKIGCDVVYKKQVPLGSNKFCPLKNENIIILYDYEEGKTISRSELKNVINYIDKHYMNQNTLMFMTHYRKYIIYTIDDFDNQFFNGFNLFKFNDKYIKYDKNNVKITDNDIQLVCKNVLNKHGEESGFKKITSTLGNTPAGINKLYSRLALGFIFTNIMSDKINSDIITFNKNIKFDIDIFKAYYNKIHDDIVNHGIIYKAIKKYI